jgi:tetratricopeptide (TPR) repeat protein
LTQNFAIRPSSLGYILDSHYPFLVVCFTRRQGELSGEPVGATVTMSNSLPSIDAAHRCTLSTICASASASARTTLASSLLVLGLSGVSAGFLHAAEAPPTIDYSKLIFEAVLLPAEQSENTSQNAVPTSATVPTGDANAATQDLQTSAAPTQADIERYQAQINSTLETNNLYADPLREQYQALGKLYQTQGEHAKAIHSFEQAIHIDRVNQGLFTQRQLSLVASVIDSYSALANFEEVNNLQEYSYFIHQKNFAAKDPQLLAAKEKWADWNVQYYLKERGNTLYRDRPFALTVNAMQFTDSDYGYVAVQNPRDGTYIYVPRAQLRHALNPNAGIADLYLNSAMYAVPSDRIIDQRLQLANTLYQELLAAPKVSDQPSQSTTLALKLANTAYASKQELDILQGPSANSLAFNQFAAANPTDPFVMQGYAKSRQTLENIARTLEQDANSNAADTAQAYIDLGDWHLGYEYSQRANAAYQKALDILTQHNHSPATIAAIFNPSPLIPAPGFALHPYSRAFFGYSSTTPLAYVGYLDVALTLNNRGRVDSARITAAPANPPQRLRSLLLDYLRDQPMRPIARNGTLEKTTALQLRIYYYY